MVVIFFALLGETLVRHNNSIITTDTNADKCFVSPATDGRKTVKIKKHPDAQVQDRTVVRCHLWLHRLVQTITKLE